MNSSYFLGANSSNGFFSLYENFCRSEGDYLTVIKGGPGSGKSRFMRKIGRRAEKDGLDVEYVICSGDIDSLDGVYIPSLKRGWVDGTAPHIADPKSFGVDGDYVNLGMFCATPLCSEKKRSAELMFKAYRDHYNRAYRHLNAFSALESTTSAGYRERELSSIADALYDIVGTKHSSAARGKIQKRFLRCICGAGEIVLNDEASELCPVLYGIGNADIDSTVLEMLNSRFIENGISSIVCLSPVMSEKYDAVLLPQYGVGFVGSRFDTPKLHKIDIPREGTEENEKTDELKEEQLALSVGELAKAKSIHDELEGIFKSEIDFDALTEYTDRYLAGLFS